MYVAKGVIYMYRNLLYFHCKIIFVSNKKFSENKNFKEDKYCNRTVNFENHTDTKIFCLKLNPPNYGHNRKYFHNKIGHNRCHQCIFNLRKFIYNVAKSGQKHLFPNYPLQTGFTILHKKEGGSHYVLSHDSMSYSTIFKKYYISQE